MRIALFGGTFDPPHRGHIAIARAAADASHLDEVLFAPTGLQPLKLEGASAPYADRLAMVAAACKTDPRFVASEIDAPRSDGLPNYTVDTLTALKRTRPDDLVFMLVGADSFLNLRNWREPDRLLDLAEWIVVSRPGYAVTDAELASLVLSAEQRSRIHLMTGVKEDVSATELRARLGRGDPCRELLPEAVTGCIEKHGLYRN